VKRAPGVATILAVALSLLPCHAGDSSGHSIYLLGSSWTQDTGRKIRLGALAGDVQVLVLIYTTCAGICPTTVKALQMFSRGAVADAQQARYLLVTIDPQRDSLEALRRYRHAMQLDATRWKLLRGSEADVRMLAAVLGFNYQRMDSGEYLHSNLVTVLNRRGEIVHQQNGADNVAELREAIHAALSDGADAPGKTAVR
jgi:protein SCO1/2